MFILNFVGFDIVLYSLLIPFGLPTKLKIWWGMQLLLCPDFLIPTKFYLTILAIFLIILWHIWVKDSVIALAFLAPYGNYFYFPKHSIKLFNSLHFFKIYKIYDDKISQMTKKKTLIFGAFYPTRKFKKMLSNFFHSKIIARKYFWFENTTTYNHILVYIEGVFGIPHYIRDATLGLV